MLKKIVVPIDSIQWDNTLNAVRTAITISRGCQVDQESELIFLHAVHMKPRISMSERDRLSRIDKKEIERDFEELGEMCEEEGLERFKTVLRNGEPSTEIVKFAQEEDADLIVMGSGKLHDRSAAGRISKFFYGSVTEEVVHRAPCSVLITRPEMNLEKVLIPVDSIEWDNTMRGVKNAMEFASGCRVVRPELVFMHVFHSPSGSEMSEERLKLEKKRMQTEFDTIRELCDERGISNVSTVIKEGDPKKEKCVGEEIAETARERDIDIVIMGSGKLHDRSTSGRIRKFIYGSVTEEVLRRAPCSVMIARPLS